MSYKEVKKYKILYDVLALFLVFFTMQSTFILLYHPIALFFDLYYNNSFLFKYIDILYFSNEFLNIRNFFILHFTFLFIVFIYKKDSKIIIIFYKYFFIYSFIAPFISIMSIYFSYN